MTATVKLTVKDTLSKLKESNPNPRRLYNRNELTALVQALMTDDDYTAENTKIKSGEFVTEERHLAKEVKKALVDLLKQIGLSAAEAQAAVEEYKVPKALAAAAIDTVHHADFLYMAEVGKGVKFLGKTDVDQTFFLRDVEARTRQYRVPAGKDGTPRTSEYKSQKVAAHQRIHSKARLNPKLKELLK